MKNKSSLSLLVCFGSAACSASAPPAPHAPAPVAATPVVTAPATSAVASNPEPEPAAPEAKSPFFVIGELPMSMKLFGAGERGLLYSERGVELQLVGDEVIHDPLLKRGLPANDVFWGVSEMGGTWPGSAWMATSHPYARTGFSNLWTWDGKAWKKKSSTQPSHFIDAMQPWVGGRLLAVEQAGMMFDASFRILSGDQHIALPKFSVAEHSDDNIFCQTQMRVEAFATLPNGEIFVAGQRCDPKTFELGPGVEHWAPGATKSTIENLPGSGNPQDSGSAAWNVLGMAALSPSNVFVTALKTTWSDEPNQPRVADHTSYFAHFDGQRWQVLPSPIAGGARKLWSEGQTLYGLDRVNQLWSGAATVGATWSPLPLPPELSPWDEVELAGFWPRANGDIWAVVNVTRAKQLHFYLLHTHAAKAPLPTIEAYERKEAELRLPGPPTDYCQTPFVLLYTLGRNAPADYDYPATRAALKGHRELATDVSFIEFSREGRRYFGARVPDFEVGKKLAKLVKGKVAGSTPELVCHDPLVQRTLSIDLATGELTK
jgi:hypothetical protein